MGQFDDSLKWCRERRAIAVEDLKDFAAGRRQFLNDVDITDKLVARAKRDIEQFDILIAAYEKRNA
jgi:hypothetical protein